MRYNKKKVKFSRFRAPEYIIINQIAFFTPLNRMSRQQGSVSFTSLPLLLLVSVSTTIYGFVMPTAPTFVWNHKQQQQLKQKQQQNFLSSSSSTSLSRMMATTSSMANGMEPTQRDAKYGGNVAQYLIDLHDTQTTFDFCGGMMFQLVLSPALRDHFMTLSTQFINDSLVQPTSTSVSVADATKYRMHQLDSYQQSSAADNLGIFHGREIRQVPWARGNMGFVLQLSLADAKDPEGWTLSEITNYDGWGHDSGRDWRTGERLEQEGFHNFRDRFGPKSFALHHRFYLHWDSLNRLWLSAEDGCEGTPAGTGNPIQNFFQGLMR